MFIITEIQTNADGTVGTLVTTKNDRNEADAEYYRVMGAAAVSALPCHACILTSEEGFPLMHGAYRHGEAAE